jgi:outer membrane autotransporter protein
MPDFISEASIGGKSDNRSALLESIRNFGKNILKKVKKEPKPKAVSSDGGDLMSQLYETLERRRSGISGEKKSAKPKQVITQAAKLTAEEIAQKKAENLARAATIREQNKKKWEEAARKNEEIARERRRAEAEAVKARIEQKAKERGENREGVVMGIDPALHHNIVSDLRSEIALLREQLKNQNGNNLAGTIGGRTEEPIYSKPIDTISMASSVTEYSEPWQDPDTLIGETFEAECSTLNMPKQIEPSAPPLSVLSSLEDLHILEANVLSEEEEKVIKMLDNAIEDSGYSGSSCGGDDDWSGEDNISDTDGYDTVYTSSGSEYSEDSGDEDGISISPPAIEEKKEELSSAVASNDSSINEVSIALDSNEPEEVSQEESAAASVLEIQDKVEEEDNLPQEISTNLDSIASTEPQQATFMSQEELRKKATMVAASHNQAREARKISSNHIKHRIFAREVLTAAVSAGEEEAGRALDDAADKTRGYSIWSSGTLGSNTQKSKADLNGHSTKIAGGTIGLELNLENDLLVGSSFGKFSSRVKYQDQGGASDLRSSRASNRAKYATHIFSLYGSRPVSRNMSVSLINSAGYSKGTKARSKLLSFEPHLNYRIELPRSVRLIPHIGLRYEYEKSKSHKEQIASSLSIERGKKSYQQFSTEIGSRVIFAPIKLKSSTPSSISITPTAHFSVERRIGSRGKSHLFTLTYHEFGETIGSGTISTNAQNERTSLNAGIGLIAGRKNIKLELLYDQQRQKRFKSHQGVLKLKVSL